MKKLLLLLLLSIFAVNYSFAQTVRFGVQAGLNESKLLYASPYAPPSLYLTGFHVGGFADFSLGAFSVEPGAMFTTKGNKNTSTAYNANQVTIGQYTYTATLNYIEVPVNLLYNIPLQMGKIFIGGGPYAALGLSGKYNTSIPSLNNSSPTSGNINFGNGIFDFKNPDYGINVLAGFKLKDGILINADYSFGLADLSNGSSSIKTSGFNISVGYEFL